jgi:hypothetical protein
VLQGHICPVLGHCLELSLPTLDVATYHTEALLTCPPVATFWLTMCYHNPINYSRCEGPLSSFSYYNHSSTKHLVTCFTQIPRLLWLHLNLYDYTKPSEYLLESSCPLHEACIDGEKEDCFEGISTWKPSCCSFKLLLPFLFHYCVCLSNPKPKDPMGHNWKVHSGVQSYSWLLYPKVRFGPK